MRHPPFSHDELQRAARAVDQLLSDVGCLVSVLVIDADATSWDQTGTGDRMHLIVGDKASNPSVVAIAPIRRPAEGEQWAQRLCRDHAAATVAVATSIDGDAGDALVSAAVGTFSQAQAFSMAGIAVCSDDERGWELVNASLA